METALRFKSKRTKRYSTAPYGKEDEKGRKRDKKGKEKSLKMEGQEDKMRRK